MIHLRIVVPSGRIDRVQGCLESWRSVHNIITLADAARRPRGDVILCDVPREEASLVIADLKDLGIAADGSIAVETVDAALSEVAREAERLAPGEPGDAVVWEQVEELTSEMTELSAGFLAFMVLATIIAAVGLLLDSPLLIIGAMVLGPEFGPIAAFSVALVERRRPLAARSFVALAAGFPVGIGAALLAVLIFKWTGLAPDAFNEGDHSFANIISEPDGFTVVVAFCAGVAGILSLTTAKSGALTGVLISVTTIPAAANIAVSAAYADWSSWRGSMLQLGINLAVLFVSGVLTLLVQRTAYRRRRARRPARVEEPASDREKAR